MLSIVKWTAFFGSDNVPTVSSLGLPIDKVDGTEWVVIEFSEPVELVRLVCALGPYGLTYAYDWSDARHASFFPKSYLVHVSGCHDEPGYFVQAYDETDVSALVAAYSIADGAGVL